MRIRKKREVCVIMLIAKAIGTLREKERKRDI